MQGPFTCPEHDVVLSRRTAPPSTESNTCAKLAPCAYVHAETDLAVNNATVHRWKTRRENENGSAQ